MHETTKSIPRRLRDVQYVRYFAGNGIDVGCGNDSLRQWQPLFPLMGDVRDWDLADGNAQRLPGISEAAFDWLHSSHCLEHVADPCAALERWCNVVRPGGHLIVLVPDEDLYEQGVWPSPYNRGHRHTFTTCKRQSWSPVSVNICDLVATVADVAFLVRLERLEATFLPGANADQTLNGVTEAAIEFVLRRTK